MMILLIQKKIGVTPSLWIEYFDRIELYNFVDSNIQKLKIKLAQKNENFMFLSTGAAKRACELKLRH